MTQAAMTQTAMTQAAIAQTPAILDRARQLTEPALKRAIATLQPELAAMANYHFGWSDANGQQLPNGGGKGVRSALAVLSAEAVSAPGAQAMTGAVAVELVHNFSLLHDDIIDNDQQRRHRPTVWALYGQDKAIILGDALHSLAFEVLLDEKAGTPAQSATQTVTQSATQTATQSATQTATQSATQAAALLAQATSAMIAGQICDMSFNQRLDVTPQECLDMEADKTGALLGYAACVGAVLAGADSHTTDGLQRYGQQLGLAFQAADDLLGIWGDPEITGKPAGNDLREKKKSLPVAYALAQGTPESDQLAQLLGQDSLDDAQVQLAAELIAQAGGRSWAQKTASDCLGESLDSLESLNLQAEPKAELVELAGFVVNRDR